MAIYVSKSTPGRHEASVCTLGLHKNHTDSVNRLRHRTFTKRENVFLGKTSPTPALDESETVVSRIDIYQVDDVVDHRRGQGRHTSYNYIYRLRPKGASSQKLTSNTELTKSHDVKNSLQHTKLNIYLTKGRLLPATSGSISHRKTIIASEAMSHRKTVVPSTANLLLASADPALVRIKRKTIRRGECE